MTQETEKFIKSIMESIGLEDYTPDDYVEVGIIFFRDWIKNKYGETISKYPISYLNNKYGVEFVNYYTTKNDEENPQRVRAYSSELTKLHDTVDFRKLGIFLVKNSLYSFVNVTENKSWFDSPSNVKIWDKMVKYLELPPYLTLDVVETRPLYIEVVGNIDFSEFVRSDIELKYSSLSTILLEMSNFLSKYAGQKFGNPAHGELKIMKGRYSEYHFVGLDEWNRTVFNKVIKPDIKKLPIGTYIRTIVCKFDDSAIYKKPYIVVSRVTNSKYSRRDEIENEINQYLIKNGYNPKNLDVRVK